MTRGRTRRRRVIFGVSIALFAAHPSVRADESGASVWLPGQFGSFAAVPSDPGFSLETTWVVSSASVSKSYVFPRGINLTEGYTTQQYAMYVTPSYTFADPILGGQLSTSVTFTLGRADTSASAVLSGRFGTESDFTSDSMTGPGDLLPLAMLKWQAGSHNFMTYVTANVPVGAYDANRLSGIGLGFWATDGGLGYTFANQAGFEFSLTAGVTYNFMNRNTQYQSGIDGHLDWGMSQALGGAFYVGAVGYFYNQLGPDSGPGALLGPFMSKVTAVGPQIGYSLDLGVVQADLNLRGYWEFVATNRPEGWNVWLTVSLSKFRPNAKARRS
jgi:hypothetical protein